MVRRQLIERIRADTRLSGGMTGADAGKTSFVPLIFLYQVESLG